MQLPNIKNATDGPVGGGLAATKRGFVNRDNSTIEDPKKG